MALFVNIFKSMVLNRKKKEHLFSVTGNDNI